MASDADDNDGPTIVRPIPRRPFGFAALDITTPGAQDDGEDGQKSERKDESFFPPSAPTVGANQSTTGPDNAGASQFLSPGWPSETGASISRPRSFIDLTSSTLFGIYSPTASAGGGDIGRGGIEDCDTPWGTGAQTPVKLPNLDDATFALMRDRAHLRRRRSSYRSLDSNISLQQSMPNPHTSTTSKLLRVSLLFLLGTGYGALVTRLHHEQQQLVNQEEYMSGVKSAHQFATALGDGTILPPGYHWSYLIFWGVAGIVIGGSLPLFDRMWEGTFGVDEDENDMAATDLDIAEEPTPSTDWAVVMRAIGAFVGIVFAIRKLAWDSTLQASMTLALVNPLLWWLIDRSVPGFVLSAGLAFVGSIFLLNVNPDMMSAPSLSPFRGNDSSRLHDHTATDPFLLAGIASQETVESGVWMISVLFCSCLCFGNIGRRLAWGRRRVARGRWGGVR